MHCGNYFYELPKDVEYDCTLELTMSCNFHCEYCSNGREREHVVKDRCGATPEDVESIANFFDSTGKWHVLIGGGEATIHPYYYDLAGRLQKKHYISIYTNLSFDVKKFLEKISSDTVVTVRCTLHSQYDTQKFFDKITILQREGYNPSMVVVATPEKFDRIEETIAQAKALSVPISIFPLAGPYRNLNYPSGYTEEEKTFLVDHAPDLMFPGHLVRLLSGKEGLVTINQPCLAGKKFFAIHAETGAVNRCSAVHEPVGNLYTGIFRPFTESHPCPSVTCIDYCYRDDLGQSYHNTFFRAPLTTADMLSAAERYAEAAEGALEKSRKFYLEKIHCLLASRRTLIWGAGMAGTFFFQAYQNHYNTGHILGFVDSNKEKLGRSILGKKIYLAESVVELNPEVIFICAPAFESEIIGILAKMDMGERVIIGMSRDITRTNTYIF